jgi:hypothetical protein
VKRLQKNIVLLDLICFVIFPLVVWNVGKDYIGAYYAMLFSSVPGIIYSLYRFYELKRINITGLFIIGNLIIGTLIDVLAGSALQMLWNNVFYDYALATFFLLTIIIKQPMALYFGLDFVELQGQDRTFSKKLFFQKKIFVIFQLITLGFALRNSILAVIKTWLIIEYGTDAFTKGLLFRQAFSWMMAGITVVGYSYISKIINQSPELIEKVKNELNIAK